MALVHTKLKIEENCEIQLQRICVNLTVICVKVVFSFGRTDDQYVCLCLFEPKLGYMALKTTLQNKSSVLDYSASMRVSS